MDPEQRWLKIASSFSENIQPVSAKLATTSQKQETPRLSKSAQILHQKPNQDDLEIRIEKLEKLLEIKTKIISDQESVIKDLVRKREEKLRGQRGKSVPNQALQIRVEQLESKLNKMMNSLPDRINQHCAKYMSNCKFKWDEESDGKLFIHDDSDHHQQTNKSIPIWKKSPNIPPKFNNCSMIRNQESHAHSKESKDDLERLENVVGKLKTDFILLLLNKLTVGKSKMKNVKKIEANNAANGNKDLVQDLLVRIFSSSSL